MRSVIEISCGEWQLQGLPLQPSPGRGNTSSMLNRLNSLLQLRFRNIPMGYHRHEDLQNAEPTVAADEISQLLLPVLFLFVVIRSLVHWSEKLCAEMLQA